MSGIYFHIPFCIKKCSYCDFYSKNDLSEVAELVKAEIIELELRRNYLDNEIVDTIYFGGGTPSLLNIKSIHELLNCVRSEFVVSDKCEITFEANPDDLTDEYLDCLFNVGINRLSIGIQSFNDSVLKFLGRRHDSRKLVHIIESAQKIGFVNISVDVIFGIPGFELSTYISTLKRIFDVNIQHISAYSLTIPEGTLIYKQLKNSKLDLISEDDLLIQFNSTIDELTTHGFSQYEISNYAKDGFMSRHNCSYWEDVRYLGIGPSAHSYNKVSRQWNISNTGKYCDNLNQNKPFYEIEYLTEADKFNEYFITGLRTSKGISKKYIIENFDKKFYRYFINKVDNLFNDNLIFINDDKISLSRNGIFISDYILKLLYYT
jgi:oxygen-independent coproporphyrinogen-3 oxidase